MRARTTTLLGALLLVAAAGCTDDGDDELPSGMPMIDAGVPSDAGGDASLPAPPLVVTTRRGQVEGALSSGVRAFLGIPFAKPPQGERRWKAPEPPEPWQGVRAANAYGPSCAQSTPSGSAFDATSSEDCLYLNVWAPATASATPRPVMVWLYGGAYVFGSGGPPYNGEQLVTEGDVVVVTLNYRLGPLGYMAHPGLSAEASRTGGAKTNFGLLDQRLALQWVRDEIAAFGGDPSNVTLFGESAGGNSVTVHMLSEPSWPLFQRAIVESGSVMKPGLTLAEAEQQGERLAKASGCTQSDPAAALACLRALPPDQVSKREPFVAAGGLSYQESGRAGIYMPVVDGQILKAQIEQLWRSGPFARVPVIHGVTNAEGALFHVGLFGDRPPANVDEYRTALTNRVGASGAARLLELYSAYATGLETVTADAVYRCPAARMARYLSEVGATQYLYRFELPVESPFPLLSGKAFHSADIPYVFGNSYLLGMVPAQHAEIARTIRGYWTRFARTGDPNGHGAPTWPRYEAAGRTQLNLANPIREGNDLGADCEIWEELTIIAP